MRVLHLADVHLDTPFAGRSAGLRARLRDASRQAFAAAVDCALREDVHVVVVAGDLFDGERLSLGTQHFLVEQLVRLRQAGINVVYATGNHDPGDSDRRRAISWPPNVVVVSDPDPRRIPIVDVDGDVRGFVTAAGHASATVTEDLSAAFPEPERALPEVAVLHTRVVDVRGGENHGPYAPSDREGLIRKGYHYWALGHVHERQAVSERPPVHYPGNLQGRTPKERGPRGGLLVDLTRPDDPTVEFRAFAPLRFETLEVADLEAVASVGELESHVSDAWLDARRDDDPVGTSWIVRIVLRGGSPLWRELAHPEERAALAEPLAASIGALDVDLWTDGVHPPVDVSEHLGRKDVLGEALRLVRAVREGSERLDIDPSELAGAADVDDVDAWIRSLLRDGEGDVLGLLLDPDAAE